MKADKYGIVTVEGRHRYAAGPEHAGARADRRAARVRGRAARCLRGPHHDASARLRRQPHQAATTRPCRSGCCATGPGPGPTARSGRRFPDPLARMARRAGARGPRRGDAHAQAGRTRERMGERGGRDGRDPRDHRRHSTRARRMPGRGPTRRPGPSPSPTTSPST